MRIPLQSVFTVALGTVALLIAGACGGGGESAEISAEDGGTVTSDDGKLVLQIPPGALDEDVEITITSAPLDDAPQELRDVAEPGAAYHLEPDGLTFSQPATAILTLDRADLPDLPEDGAGSYLLVTQGDDGEPEALDGQVTEATLGEETLQVRGMLSHFSWLTKRHGALVVTLEQVSPQQPVNARFGALGDARNWSNVGYYLENFSSEGVARGTVSVVSWTGPTASDTLSPDDPEEAIEFGAVYACGEDSGPGTYGASVVGRDRAFGTTHAVVLTVEVECVEGVLTPTSPPSSGTAAPQPTTAPAPTITNEQLGAVADEFIRQQDQFLGDYTLDGTRTGPVSNDDWDAGSLNGAEAAAFAEDLGRTGGYRAEWFSSTSFAYQMRISLSVFNREGGATDYLAKVVPFWQRGIGSQSAHEGPLQGVTPFTLGDPLANGIGVTLTFGVAGNPDVHYYQTYVAFADQDIRGSVSFFTTPSPNDKVRSEAIDLAAALQQVLEEQFGR